jgi:amidase
VCGLILRRLADSGFSFRRSTALLWAGYTNLCGLPATAVPLGLSNEGLPIGAQVCGPVFADPVCLRFARWLEQEYRGFVAPPLAA